ncbi:MAG: hypothetical protein NVS2B9_10240 [Myxococcales bacterium]
MTLGQRSTWALGLLAALSMGRSATAAPTYRAIDIAAVVGRSAVPVAIDRDGVVALWSLEAGKVYSMLYDSKTNQVIYRFPEGDQVRALSDHGNAVGNSPFGPWLFAGGVRTQIPLALVLGVNDAGEVAGMTGGFYLRAALYSSATRTVTDVAPGSLQSGAFAINEAGQVAGGTDGGRARSAQHAFRWDQGVLEDLGTLGGAESRAKAINAGGQVAGFAEVSATVGHAFLFDGSMLDLGSLPGCERSGFAGNNGVALNGRGAVVGTADLCSSTTTRAFLFVEGQIYDLNQLTAPPADGFVYADATAINDRGSIVGVATSPVPFGPSRPFLLVRSDE